MRRIPSVLRSRRHLEQQGVSFLAPGAIAPETLPITDDGATFNMAQEVTWIDPATFAVGRWDGTLSLFRFNDSPTVGPLITRAASTPAMEGVQMIVWLQRRVFVTSNDESSLVLWTTGDGSWGDLRGSLARFDAVYGVANSGDAITIGEDRYLVVGHSNGYMTTWIWRGESAAIEMLCVADLRSDSPTNPWGLHNIRGVASVSSDARGIVVTGSENGLLCAVEVRTGRVLTRTTYNPTAQRGINSVALLGTKLLVSNCAVGREDRNLWFYELDLSGMQIMKRDSARLVVNPDAPQIFNFCTIWGEYAAGPCFFASTEEGALWMGAIDASGKLAPIGYRRTTSPLGAALAYNRTGRLVLVAYDLHEYRTGVAGTVGDAEDPERLSHP